MALEDYRNIAEYWSRASDELERKGHSWEGWEMLIFSRATVCNVFIVEKFLYVFQCVHCTQFKYPALLPCFSEVYLKNDIGANQTGQSFSLFELRSFGVGTLFHKATGIIICIFSRSIKPLSVWRNAGDIG